MDTSLENQSESYEIPEGIFRTDKHAYLEDYLNRNMQNTGAFFALARATAKDKQELVRTYHNLFQFNEEKSNQEIRRCIAFYEQRLSNAETKAYEKEKLETRIAIAEEFLKFMEHYPESSWIHAQNAARTLEEILP